MAKTSRTSGHVAANSESFFSADNKTKTEPVAVLKKTEDVVMGPFFSQRNPTLSTQIRLS